MWVDKNQFYTDYECVNLFYLQNTPVTPRGQRLSTIFRRQVKNHPWKLSLIGWGVKFEGCEEALTLDAENQKGTFAFPKCLKLPYILYVNINKTLTGMTLQVQCYARHFAWCGIMVRKVTEVWKAMQETLCCSEDCFTHHSDRISLFLMSVWPCIVDDVKRVKPTRCYTLVYWTLWIAQHVSGITMPIVRSLRL